MTSGIRAEVRIPAVQTCPVALISAQEGARSSAVSKSISLEDPTHMTEEFVMDVADLDDAARDLDVCIEPVFTYGDQTAYRFERERGSGCPCEVVESHGSPVIETHTRDGDVYLAFHAHDMDSLRTVIGDLRDRYPDLEIQRLLHSRSKHPGTDLVFIDRGELTERQREVLQTAHEMGYFDHPKGANATEVAGALDISRTTFSEHLAAAQRKLLGAIVD